MTLGRADLHTHTTASDGLDSPAALVKLAHERGISVLAITDHDTVGGVAEAAAAARETDVQLVPGVEFSARARRGQTHVLGYGIDITDATLTAELEALRQSRQQRGRTIIQRLHDLGIQVPLETMALDSPDQSPGRPHIARALMDMGIVSSVAQAFEEYLAVGRPAFVPRKTVTDERAIQLIHRAGGLAVLAHPLSVYQLDAALSRLIRAGLDGLEAYYAEYDRDQRESLANLATTYNLLVTGGSDYHGDHQSAGRVLGSVDWPHAAVTAILERLK